ncbi:MAG: hypothetical protein QOF85_173, partial [Solirubrobacterales bacterium]|nr:hypothetical protein [Solirubrobacterales bacterium]
LLVWPPDAGGVAGPRVAVDHRSDRRPTPRRPVARLWESRLAWGWDVDRQSIEPPREGRRRLRHRRPRASWRGASDAVSAGAVCRPTPRFAVRALAQNPPDARAGGPLPAQELRVVRQPPCSGRLPQIPGQRRAQALWSQMNYGRGPRLCLLTLRLLRDTCCSSLSLRSWNQTRKLIFVGGRCL